MNYDKLDATYWANQQARISELVSKIRALPSVGDGRVIPEDTDLAIGTGRRLSMAVMFIDICGFSSRPMETTQEQDLMLRVLNLYFTEMIRIAEEYGGNVEKNTGDGLMVYFNDNEGTPPECGPKRAVACALTMLAATKHLINPVLLKSKVEPIKFRISIDYGNVTIARIGAPRRFNANTAVGATANFASKMMRNAHENEIVIGESARAKLPDLWQTNWTSLIATPTGWHYVSTKEPYRLYKYTGRWTDLN